MVFMWNWTSPTSASLRQPKWRYGRCRCSVPNQHKSVLSQNVRVQAPFPEVNCPGGNAGGGVCGAFGDPAQLTIQGLSIVLAQEGNGHNTAAAFNGFGFSGLTFADGSILDRLQSAHESARPYERRCQLHFEFYRD